MIRTATLLAASLVFITTAQAADQPKETPASLEQLLLGSWKGGACVGDYTFNPDGTFELAHFTPGGNLVTGTWSLRWDALPPTLALKCETSDFRKKDPSRTEFKYVGKTLELKLVELNAESLACAHPEGYQNRYNRVPPDNSSPEKKRDKELAALQGTWVPLEYEEGGQKVRAELNTRHVIQGDKVTVVVNGETIAEGKVVVDPTQYPRHLDLQFPSGRTDLLIYVRAGDSVIYCGNRDGKTRPSEFASGTARGGAYLMAWKIEK